MWPMSRLRALGTEINQSKQASFLRQFIVYLGPALIVSVAYMDPGNYGTDIAAGVGFKYDLVWAVWLASGIAMILQYLSGKLGIATGKSLPEEIRNSLKRNAFVVPYWLSAELAAAATDLAEYLGTVIALNLLFGVPLLYAAIFGALDVILIMGLMTRRFRLIEQYFMMLVTVLVFGFLYELTVVKPSISQIFYHSLVPSLPESSALALVVGIIGATVMPHALFLHSWLTKNKLKADTIEEKRITRKFHLWETVILLTIAGVVNVGILLVATPLYPSQNAEIQYVFQELSKFYGSIAGVVFVLTLLASGLTSSTTGTIAGQVIMEGLIGKRANIWVRRIITRFVNVFPTTVAIFIGLDPLSLLIYSQVILSILIPLPMIPLIYYTSKKNIMGEFVNRRMTTALAIVVASIIITFNLYLLMSVA